MVNENKKSGEDLWNEPNISAIPGAVQQPIDTPFNQVIDMLSVTEGKKLELMTRANKAMADAMSIGYGMVFRFGSGYVGERIDQLKRLAVSMGGKGRTEIVQSLQAGSGVPDSFFEMQSNATKTYSSEE